jgi:uncharacterized protein (TIGR04168 family)
VPCFNRLSRQGDRVTNPPLATSASPSLEIASSEIDRTSRSASESLHRTVRIAVVGDIHNQWDHEDEAALVSLEVDLALFVGDFGNEAVDIVAQVAQLPIPSAIALGNHDAWHSATPWGRKKCPYDRSREDRVQQQLDALGTNHVGYGKREIPEQQLSIVGGRPFSWGGPNWKYEDFYLERFKISSMQDSGERIIEAVQQTQHNTLIFLSHNGPAGLGAQPEAPCGRDWQPIGGDYGDPDLRSAIQTAKALGKHIPLVAFGHMHHNLRHRKDRLRQRVRLDSDGILYLNAACVPRVAALDSVRYSNFSVVQLTDGQVAQVHSVWVSAQGAIAQTEPLFEQSLNVSV